MLIFSYKHDAYVSTAPSNTGIPPTDPLVGYSHVHLSQMGYASSSAIQDLRLYCTTSNHGRRIHFKATHDMAKQIAFSGSQVSNLPSIWTDSTRNIVYADHTAYLPSNTNAGYTQSDGSFYAFPLFKSGTYHWGVGSLGRWEW